MANQFTLDINSRMELLDNTINPSFGNISSSNDSDYEFMPLSQSNFLDDHYQRHDHSLPFTPLPEYGTNDYSSFTFIDDHDQAGSFYDPTANYSTTNEMASMISRDESFTNLSLPNFRSKVTGKNKARRNNRKNKNGTEVEKVGEVVLVRAKRGEATDRHSLAERLRREKINKKLRSLQELVPGCYKTMGMSIMFDVTINYIRSLQNQIEFLSMKLTAASLFYDFNSAEMEILDSIKVTNGYHEADDQVMDRMGEEGYGELLQFQSSWPLSTS